MNARRKYLVLGAAAALLAVLLGLGVHSCGGHDQPPPAAPARYGFQFPTPPPPVAGIPVFNVQAYGATGNGVTDDRTFITAAMAAACSAGGGNVFFPMGTYLVSRNGANSYAMDLPCGNLTLVGIRGKSWIKLQAGQPNSQVVLMRIDRKDMVTIRDMGFDGNWGNAATTVAQASTSATLPQSTINVVDTSAFPAGAISITVVSTAGPQSVSCTGSTATTFTGCTGGTGTIMRGYSVGYVDGISGINHATQVDPQDILIFSRGSTNLTIENSNFRQAYGDCIWLGGSGGSGGDNTKWQQNTRISNVTCDMAARVGIAFGGAVLNTLIRNVILTNCHQEGIDSEPVAFPVRNVDVAGSVLGGWWDPAQPAAGVIAIHVENGAGGWGLPGSANKNWRIHDSTLVGAAQFVAVFDVVFSNNSSSIDWNTTGKANVLVEQGGGTVTIADNWLYNRSTQSGLDGGGDTGDVVIYNYASGAAHYSPPRVDIVGNQIHARNSHNGIVLVSPGGDIQTASGTASSVTDTTLVDSGAAWTTNIFQGATVSIGTAHAVIDSNTATTLTLHTVDNSVTSAWQTEQGLYEPTPAAGAYVIRRDTGVIDIARNNIDLRDDGNGKGQWGVYLTDSANALPGGRIRIRENKIYDANAHGIRISWSNTTTYPLLDIADNFGMDDQAVHTFTNLLDFANAAPNVAKWVMHGNIAGENVTNTLATTYTFTANSATDILTTGIAASNGLRTGDGPIFVATTLSFPSPLAASTPYYYIKSTSNTGKLATSVANAKAGTAIDLTTNGTGTLTMTTQNWLVGTFDASGNSSLPHCSNGVPSASNGTLAPGSTNCEGSVSSVGATSTVLTYSGAYASTSFCTTTIETNSATHITVTRDKTAPTFSCFDTSNVAATCPDFTYHCEGL